MQHLIRDSKMLQQLYYHIRKGINPHHVKQIADGIVIPYVKQHPIGHAHPALTRAAIVPTGRYQLDEIIDTLDIVTKHHSKDLDDDTKADMLLLLSELRRANQIIDGVILRMRPAKRHYPPYLDPKNRRYW